MPRGDVAAATRPTVVVVLSLLAALALVRGPTQKTPAAVPHPRNFDALACPRGDMLTGVEIDFASPGAWERAPVELALSSLGGTWDATHELSSGIVTYTADQGRGTVLVLEVADAGGNPQFLQLYGCDSAVSRFLEAHMEAHT